MLGRYIFSLKNLVTSAYIIVFTIYSIIAPTLVSGTISGPPIVASYRFEIRIKFKLQRYTRNLQYDMFTSFDYYRVSTACRILFN